MRLLREILAPLVHADGGEMHLVSATADSVHIHLSGACSGCPGASVTREKVLTPVLLSVVPKARVVVTTGIHPPAGATKVDLPA